MLDSICFDFFLKSGSIKDCQQADLTLMVAMKAFKRIDLMNKQTSTSNMISYVGQAPWLHW